VAIGSIQEAAMGSAAQRPPERPARDARSRNLSAWLAPAAMLLLGIALAQSSGALRLSTAGPILWFSLICYIALRERSRRWVATLFVPAAVLFLLWFARAALGICLPFLLALLLAYLLDPLVDRMERRIGRSRAIVLLALPVFLILFGLALVLLPALFQELRQLLDRLPELRPLLDRAYASLLALAADWGIQIERRQIVDEIVARLQSLAPAVAGAGLGVVRGLQGLVDFVSFLVITPVLSFYLLRDFDRLRGGALAQLSGEQRGAAEDFLGRLDRSLSGYLRGQLLVGVMVGILFYVGMTAMRMDYALLVGLASIVFNLIPFVGSVLTALLAVAVGLLSDPSWISLVKVGTLYGGIQTLDAALISPRVMGNSLQLHPVAVMLALLLAGRFFGMAGLLLAVPALAVLKESARRWTPEILSLLVAPERSSSSPTRPDS
jgi:predicted PurR-regulated permease PerM